MQDKNKRTGPAIHLAFRFHGNFYHSFRGDTPDERGFGKDIRVIRHILSVLDRFNEEGIEVKGTWDFENYFSLETIMPKHCPDIIERMKRRTAERGDEVQVMSYNNGMISAHTAAEFDAAISRAVHNEKGSGLADLFGSFGPMVRPQEMMFTPKHLDLYPRHGIHSISLFYSALPFNGFSSFVPPLSLKERYNPLELWHPQIEGRMTLLPAYNIGDILDHISLRRWVKLLRRRQLAEKEATDLLLLLDMDADDEFWCGYDIPLISRVYSSGGGLEALVKSLNDLDYLVFTTPSAYLAEHPPAAEITFGQDTADGSFDGLASWAEKWSNQMLWTELERARILELQTRRLLGTDRETAGVRAQDTSSRGSHAGPSSAVPDIPVPVPAAGERQERSEAHPSFREIERLLAESFELRLRLLSTTHFGMAAPVVNATRLKTAKTIVGDALDRARQAFALAAGRREKTSTAEPQLAHADRSNREAAAAFTLIDYPRGVGTEAVSYPVRSSRSLVRIPLRRAAGENSSDRSIEAVSLIDEAGNSVPHLLCRNETDREELLLLRAAIEGGGKRTYRLAAQETSSSPNGGGSPKEQRRMIEVSAHRLGNSFLKLSFDERGRTSGLEFRGPEEESLSWSSLDYPLIDSAVSYRRKTFRAKKWEIMEIGKAGGGIGFLDMRSSIPIGGGMAVKVRRRFIICEDLPYLYIDVQADYPQTPFKNRNRAKVKRLERDWDQRWREVMPCILAPGLMGSAESPLRVWKHNFLNHVGSYRLDYGAFSPNRELDSVNNHVTDAWLAVCDGRAGLLCAQTADRLSSLAFCPLRTRRRGDAQRVFLNPFGSFSGRQYRYQTADTGIGKTVAVRLSASDHISPYAPSYNGRTQRFSLMLAPYIGDRPPEELQADAQAFSYPYLLMSSSARIGEPAHRLPLEWKL